MLEFFKKILSTNSKKRTNNTSDNKVDNLKKLKVIKILNDLAPEIEKHSTSCIEIKTQIASPLNLSSSKFGGLPYFPKTATIPTDSSANPMRLLAQLNFKEIPNLAPYPTKGLLQFFIAEDDDIYGLDFNNPLNQNGFRVLFWEDLNFEPLKDFRNLYSKDWEYAPLHKEPLILDFKIKKDYPFFPAIEYEKNILPLFQSIKAGHYEEALEDLYLNQDLATGHKIGGYPYFTQNEIRDKSIYADYQLLFQMDSDEDKIMWGDIGVANFFIQKEALLKRDFSKVLYNWDCH